MKLIPASIPGFAALAAVVTSLLAAAPAAAQVQDLQIAERPDPIIIVPPDPSPCPTLRAGDITARAPFHDVKLFFPWWPGIDESTIGDGDLIAKGPNGYLQKATFVSLERHPVPFPLPLTTASEGAEDVIGIPQPHPIVVATYRFFPPPRRIEPNTRNSWLPLDNGPYHVGLVEGEIATDGGRFFPPKFLGGFRCIIRVDPPVTIQPEHIRCAVRRHRPAIDEIRPDGTAITARYRALVALCFRTPHVRIDWGSVTREGNTFKANATAVRLPIPGPDPEPVPLPLAGQFRPEPVEGEPVVDPDPTRPELLPCFRHRYDLGSPAPGEYRFVLCVNGVVVCTDAFRVPPIPPIDDEPPGAELEVRNITEASDRPQRMVVTYKDRSGVSLSSIGDGDLVVYSPCLFVDAATSPVPCDWGAQRARLVELLSVSDDRQVVKALYEIDAPRSGWTHRHNGFYPVVLWEDAVCDRLGNCTDRERLGGFEVAIDPNQPPVPAEAEVKVDPSDPDRVKAKVHIRFKDYFHITNQSIRRDGNRIYLLATAEPYVVPAIFPPPPLPEEELSYDVGPLRDGDYAAIFVMNGHIYDAERFTVKRSPPIPAEVALAIDASNPDNVLATVKIQFRTPHRVVQGDVQREGHRLLLPAKAEPLPILFADEAIRPDGSIDPAFAPRIPPVPEPVVLTYRLGALEPGGYLAIFEMNEFPYAAEEFKIDDPGPPIPAEVALRVNQDDPGNTVVVATIRFRTPHVITKREVHRSGNRFVLAATAVPIDTLATADLNGFAPVPIPQVVTVEYPLGDLEAGQYGAAFVMNGWPYADTTWTERDHPFDAEVSIHVAQMDSGSWTAHVKVLFSNPNVRIIDPGVPTFNGAIIMINARAALRNIEPVDPAAGDAPSGPIELTYDLGRLRPGGHWLKFFINDHFEQQHDFVVPPEPPIPAEVEVKVDTSNDPVLATAIIQFHDHYRVTKQDLHLLGNIFILDATAEGPLPILAPLPPPPVELTYDLGSLRPGHYFAAFRMNGHIYDIEPFLIREPGFEAKVDLSIKVDDNDAKLTAVVDFDDPYIVITNPGRPVISGNTIKINATAERVVFVQEPSGDPVTLCYDLENLAPGHYQVDYCINGLSEAGLRFEIPRPCQRPANVSHIRIAQGDASWFAQVGVILAPGQVVTDWGVVRQSGNGFHVNITVECVDFPIDPVPLPFEPLPLDPSDLPAGIEVDAGGDLRIGDLPVQIVTHEYPLGILAEGHYAFCVHSLGQTVACKRFEVPGSPPRVEVSVGNITSATNQHHFGITYHDPTGLDHDSIRNAEVWIVSNTGYRERAELLSYASTDDVPSSSASARYAVHGPGGSWDHADNGKYRIVVDPAAIRDLQGNHLEDGRIGCFYVRILPEPPLPGVNVAVAPNAAGEWEATVEIISERGRQVVINNWEFLCLQFGHSIVKLADATIQPTSGPVEPIAHTYNLGALQPGYYVFVFKTDLAHCGIASFTVPGAEGDPLDNWQLRAGFAAQSDEEDTDQDGLNLVGEYFFLTDPEAADAPDIHAEIVTDAHGRRHFGLRVRHLHGAEGVTRIVQGSSDLENWVDVDDRINVVEQKVDLDGSVVVLLCLRDTLEESPYHFLRIAAVRDRN